MFGLNFKHPRGFVAGGKVHCSFDASVMTVAQSILKLCILALCKCKKSGELKSSRTRRWNRFQEDSKRFKKHLELIPTSQKGRELVESGYLATSKRLARIRGESRNRVCVWEALFRIDISTGAIESLGTIGKFARNQVSFCLSRVCQSHGLQLYYDMKVRFPVSLFHSQIPNTIISFLS